MLLLVNYTPAQRWLADIAESRLENKLGTDVSIDRLEIGLFNRVVLHNVRILDQKGETLLEARQMSAKIEYRALLESRVSLRTVSLLDANINLYRERPDAPTNFDFVVKAFSSKEKKEPSRLNLTLGSVIIRRCHFRWDERWQVRKPHQFTASHIDVRDFNANVSLRCLTPDSINLRLRSLSFTEASGLDVHSLSFRLAGNRRHCVVTNFSLQLHGSRFDEDHLEASYDVDSAQPFLTTLTVSGRVNLARLSLTDIACFVPRLRDFPYTVECSTAFSVNPEAIDVSTLTLKELEDRIQLTAHAKFLRGGVLRGGGLQAADTRGSGIYRVSGGIDRLFIADGAASTLLAPLLSESTQALLNRLGQTTLTATGFVERGQRSQLKVEAQTACGQAYASVHWLGDRLNVQASSTGFDLANLLGHSADGVGQGSSHIPTDIAFQADAEAQLEDKHVTDFTLSTIVERVSYNGQTYRDLRLTASKQGNTLQGELHSGDPALALDGTASTTLSGNTPTSLTADLTFHQLTPATFGLSGKYAAASYTGHLTADLPVLTGKNRRGTLTLSDFHKSSQVGAAYGAADSRPPMSSDASGSDGTPAVDEGVATKNHRVADYSLRALSLTFSPSQRGTHLHLSSDFAVADLDGDLSTSRVKGALMSRLQRVLPSLFSASNTQSATAARRSNSAESDLTFNARLTKPDFFQTMLGLPLDFSDEVLIEGKLSGDAQTSLLASSPFVSYNGVALNNLRLYLRGDGQELTTLVQGAKDFKSTRMKFALSATAKDDVVDSELQWDDGETHRYAGSVSTLTTLTRTLDRQLAVSSNLRPTNISIGDTLWTLGAANVTAVGSNLRVNHVNLSHDRVGDTPQSLTISGELTRQPSDSLKIELRDIDISYILSLANVRPVSFGGQATGTLIATQVGGAVSRPPMSSEQAATGGIAVGGTLHVPHFTFNGGNMGDADIAVGFNTHDLRINMDARMEEAGVGNTHVVGYVGIAEKGLDLDITGRNTTLRFLRRYLPAMFQDIDGRTTGHCRLHGSFKALDIEGDERVSFYAKMSPLGTGFHLYDGTVTMSSDDDASGRSASFVFKDFKMKDDARGTGTLSGRMLHNHFKKFHYDFYANFSDMLVYDKGRSDDMPFYATAYGTGDVHLYGQPGSFTADINARPTRGTTMTYIVDTHSSSVDVSLLTFGTKVGAAVSRPPISSDASRSDGTLAVGEKQAATSGASKLTTNNSTTNNSSSKTDINLNFVIDMQPEADVRIVMDEKTANTITLAGTGALRATYYNKGAFQMFGNFLVDHGLYKLTIQDVIQKNLHFESGGNIVFAGNPFDGELNLKAVYTVPSVSLSDLGLNLSNASVRADCILHMGGKVLSPQITFGLDLPDASDEVKQMVHQFVTTDEDMNRQVLHLLGLGRFYNYNFAATDAALGGQSQTNVAMKSLLASTITTQLNNIIQNAVGTSDWTFGANLTTGQIGWSDMEVAGMLSGSLFSGRLLVNGNFGYRERALSNTNFVGDFDISYLLTPGGGIRLKAYSETNDRYFSKSALTTQGIGIQFRRDFTRLGDLFGQRRRRATSSPAITVPDTTSTR